MINIFYWQCPAICVLKPSTTTNKSMQIHSCFKCFAAFYQQELYNDYILTKLPYFYYYYYYYYYCYYYLVHCVHSIGRTDYYIYTHIQQRWQIYHNWNILKLICKRYKYTQKSITSLVTIQKGEPNLSLNSCDIHTHTHTAALQDVTPCSTMGVVGAQPATCLYGITVMFTDTIRRTSNPELVLFLPCINIMLCNFFYLPGCDWTFPYCMKIFPNFIPPLPSWVISIKY